MQSDCHDDDVYAEPGVEPPAFVVASADLSMAFSLARRAHHGHTRGGHGRPYLEHPIQVAELLRDEGYGEVVCAAGLLHDVVEDSGFTTDAVTERFGAEVGRLVAALTEDPTIADWEARKRALREQAAESGAECAAIYIADKLANLHDWRLVYAEVGERAAEFFKAPTLTARVRAWRSDLEMGESVVPRLRMTSLLRGELERFERDRSKTPAPGAEDESDPPSTTGT